MTQGNIDDFSNADSENLKTIDGQKFTIVAWEKSDYTDEKGKVSKGIKLITKDGKKYHTTRIVVVQKFYSIDDGKIIPTKLGQACLDGTEFEVVCKEMKAKMGGKPYFDLVKPEET